MKKNPYISIIISFRNDNYLGQGLKRTQVALDNLIYQAKKYNLSAELIIVEWNPPQDRPLLKEALRFPYNFEPLTIKFITVPPQIHKRHGCSEKIQLIPVASQNVGIRRARGKFILPTNSDILFSNEIIRFLAEEKLDSDKFYRANRHDVNKNVLKCYSSKERMDFCRKNIIRSCLRGDVSSHGLPDHPILHTNGVDFIVFSKESWHLLHGWPETNNLGLHTDGILCYMAYLLGLEEQTLESPMEVYHIDHKSRWRPKRGLFWRALHKFLPDLKNQDPDFNLENLYSDYRRTLISMLKKERSYIYNDENWGLPQENFEEFIASFNNEPSNQ